MPIPKIPIHLALRTRHFQESAIREMTLLGDETGSINLSQGLPDFEPPAEVTEAAMRAIASGDNQYTFPFGSTEFRKAVAAKSARYNHIPADPETDVTITCGVSEAMMASILALTDPGDEVIVLEPWYENYVPDCLMAGVAPQFVPLREPDYAYDPDELRGAFNNHTRLIMINTPHNPTGRVFTREELQGIARLCEEFGVIALSDEIYEHILYDGRQHISLGSLPGMEDRAVTISGLGKSYAVTGWRVGWAVAPAPISALIRKVHDYLTVCAPAPFQNAGVTALSLPACFYDEMRRKYSAWREILLEALGSAGFQYSQPEGAYYVMADFGGIEWPSQAYLRPEWTLDRSFAEYLARQVGVAVVPGSSFYADRSGGLTRVRFNFAKREETLREARKRLLRLKQ